MLFKIARGPEKGLDKLPLRNGRMYITDDTAKVYVDLGEQDGDRKQINAYAAEILRSADGKTEINIEDIVLGDMISSIEQGGTGADNAEDARDNLDVYSKTETDSAVDARSAITYNATLATNSWVASGDKFTYSYANTALKCGKLGDIPPIIVCTANEVEYNYIESGMATQGVGIIFTAKKQPTGNIALMIVDHR